MSEKAPPRPVVLCVLDGWGVGAATDCNAIAQAKTPVWDQLMAARPHALLDASEHEVGLPLGQMGNSEVGHMNIGAGRIVLQDLPRIDDSIANGEIAANPALVEFIAALRKSGGTCHLFGLVSPGGVHSHQNHIAALARILDGAGVPVALHAVLDGRDTPPKSAEAYVARLRDDLEECGSVRFATVSGRYYAMDRDRRWDRIERAFETLVDAKGDHAADPLAAIAKSYAAGVSDEFVLPMAIGDYDGMRDGDGLLTANFRSDRVRQILLALLDPSFKEFARGRLPRFAAAAGMTEYAEALNALQSTLFPSAPLRETLGEVVAAAGRRQLRIAETEKYPHVTFFFNGGEEKTFPGEERILVPSPKIATYDLQPEMSAAEVTERLIAAIEGDSFDLIVVNYANTDMVGHTGRLDAAIRAVETVDSCLGRLIEAVRRRDAALLITADHGNAEQMCDSANGEPHTAHTRNRVPVILIEGDGRKHLRDGRLADVAPTLLALMGLAPPAAMTGRSLIATAPSNGLQHGAENHPVSA